MLTMYNNNYGMDETQSDFLDAKHIHSPHAVRNHNFVGGGGGEGGDGVTAKWCISQLHAILGNCKYLYAQINYSGKFCTFVSCDIFDR